MGLEVNNENLEQVLNDKKVTVLQFSAEWCGPCKMLTPIMLKLGEENTENDVTIAKVNVDTNGEIGTQYRVRNIPTLVYLKDGVEVERSVGMKSKSEIQAVIDNLLMMDGEVQSN